MVPFARIHSHSRNTLLLSTKTSILKRPFFENLSLKSLNEKNKILLERSFTEEEIFTAVCSLAGDKTLGPDGFPVTVYQKASSLMKNDIMEVFNEFHRNGYIDW